MYLFNTPAETAEILKQENVSIETYQEVQNRRLERLALWKERKIAVLVEKETELVEFGEEVLRLMKVK